MNKQRVTLHFSLHLGNLASNYRICFNSPEWFTKAWIRLGPEECQPGDTGRVEAVRQGEASAAKGEMTSRVNLSQSLGGIHFPSSPQPGCSR